MDTGITLVVTVLLFIVAFGCLYLQIHRSTGRVKIWFFLFAVISAGPLLYIQIDDYMHQYLDANIGLGLAYFYTWFMTAVAAVAAIVSYLRNTSKAH